MNHRQNATVPHLTQLSFNLFLECILHDIFSNCERSLICQVKNHPKGYLEIPTLFAEAIFVEDRHLPRLPLETSIRHDTLSHRRMTCGVLQPLWPGPTGAGSSGLDQKRSSHSPVTKPAFPDTLHSTMHNLSQYQCVATITFCLGVMPAHLVRCVGFRSI
jgi:hypothetical protein